MAGAAVAAIPDDIAETHKGLVQLFSSTDDQRSVRESGQAIAALDESTKARHLEMQQSIKGVRPGPHSTRTPLRALVPLGLSAPSPLLCASAPELTGVTNRMLDELNDRKSNLLDPTTKRELLAQKSRAEDNIRRMQEDNASLQNQVGALSNKATDLTTSEQQIKQRAQLASPSSSPNARR